MDRLISTYILAQTDSQEQADAAIQDIVMGILTFPFLRSTSISPPPQADS